jgi:centrin-1
MMTARISDKNTRDDIERVFKLFDSNRNGFISLEDMKRVAKELGEDISEKELQEIIQRADLDNDSKLTIEDFYQVMTKKTFA